MDLSDWFTIPRRKANEVNALWRYPDGAKIYPQFIHTEATN